MKLLRRFKDNRITLWATADEAVKVWNRHELHLFSIMEIYYGHRGFYIMNVRLLTT